MDCPVSAVIICKNEERTIARCIESVLSLQTDCRPREVLLVDSLSKDNTLAIAARYPISILQLRPHWRHTPAAGRYIGFHETHGEYVLFLDGDSEVCEKFPRKALDQLCQDSTVAGVVGRRIDIYYGHNGKEIGRNENAFGLPEHVTKVSRIVSCAILRRTALENVGGYNPYLYSEEELELSDRLTEAGYSIVGIPIDMAMHHTVRHYTLSGFLRRTKNRFHLGPGQVVRLRLGKRMSPMIRAHMLGGVLPVMFLAASVFIAALSLAFKSVLPVGGWIIVCFFAFLRMATRSKSVVFPLRYSFIQLIYAAGFIRGLLMKPKKLESYPTDPVRLKSLFPSEGLGIAPGRHTDREESV